MKMSKKENIFGSITTLLLMERRQMSVLLSHEHETVVCLKIKCPGYVCTVCFHSDNSTTYSLDIFKLYLLCPDLLLKMLQ